MARLAERVSPPLSSSLLPIRAVSREPATGCRVSSSVTQWAAVTTHSTPTSDPVQKWRSSLTCVTHGYRFFGASPPPIMAKAVTATARRAIVATRLRRKLLLMAKQYLASEWHIAFLPPTARISACFRSRFSRSAGSTTSPVAEVVAGTVSRDSTSRWRVGDGCAAGVARAVGHTREVGGRRCLRRGQVIRERVTWPTYRGVGGKPGAGTH